MKKIYFLLFAVLSSALSYAQTVTNAGMETWRSGTSGTAPVVPIQAPYGWFGNDSLAIAVGESFVMDTALVPQLFREDTFVHSGSHAAKILTRMQDSTTIRLLPGILTNAQISFSALVYLLTMDPTKAITFSGGEPVTLKITSVSAYVAYFPGIDTATHMMGGADTGALTVEAHGFIHGTDTVLGRGFAQIPPGSTYAQITAPIVYTDTVDSVGLIRIFFASSGGGRNVALDSSMLYVDDISMTGVPEPIQPDHTGINNIVANNGVTVYPNPANGTLYFSGPQSAMLEAKLYSVSGQVVAAKTFTGNTSLDVANLPDGLYFYAISDEQGGAVQRGKVVVSK
jgi:hypothetical protein